MRRLLPCGASAVLVECADAADALALCRRLDATRPPGVEEVVAGACTVLVVGDLEDSTRAFIATVDGMPAPSATGTAHTVEVVYDGEDLAAVAAATGLSAARVVELHTSASYRVGFAGFAPGFAYLTGLAPELRVPRRPTPRTRVAAGSVAIADIYTAVYPIASPGGWHLIGRTGQVMFDARRDPPNALSPGDTVRFVRAG